MLTGLRSVPEADYHADPDSLSFSGAKLILRSPALYRYDRDHPATPTPAMEFGSLVHGKVLGVDGAYRAIEGGRGRADRETEARAAGLIPVTTEQVETAEAMAEAVRGHSLAARLLSEGEPEQSAYALDEPTNVMRRCRIDLLGPVPVDYKTTRSADPRDIFGRWGHISKYGYDKQAAWYLDVLAALGIDAPLFAFIFQEKTPPYLVTVATIRADELAVARERNRTALERFRDCTDSGLWPGYVRDDAYVEGGFNHPNDYEEKTT